MAASPADSGDDPGGAGRELSGHYDVAVVGGGLAGLAVALRLVDDHGVDPRRVIVLEGADTVGGRTLSVVLPSGHTADVGGQWVSAAHSEMLELVRRLGLSVLVLSRRGARVVDVEGRLSRSEWYAPSDMPLWLQWRMAQAIWRMDAAAKGIDPRDAAAARFSRILESVTAMDLVRWVAGGLGEEDDVLAHVWRALAKNEDEAVAAALRIDPRPHSEYDSFADGTWRRALPVSHAGLRRTESSSSSSSEDGTAEGGGSGGGGGGGGSGGVGGGGSAGRAVAEAVAESVSHAQPAFHHRAYTHLQRVHPEGASVGRAGAPARASALERERKDSMEMLPRRREYLHAYAGLPRTGSSTASVHGVEAEAETPLEQMLAFHWAAQRRRQREVSPRLPRPRMLLPLGPDRWASGSTLHRLFNSYVRAFCGVEAAEVSALCFLSVVASWGGMAAMVRDGPNSPHGLSVAEGAQAVSVGLARHLAARGVRVATSAPVAAISGWTTPGLDCAPPALRGRDDDEDEDEDEADGGAAGAWVRLCVARPADPSSPLAPHALHHALPLHPTPGDSRFRGFRAWHRSDIGAWTPMGTLADLVGRRVACDPSPCSPDPSPWVAPWPPDTGRGPDTDGPSTDSVALAAPTGLGSDTSSQGEAVAPAPGGEAAAQAHAEVAAGHWAGGEVFARRVVLAMPPPSVARVRFQPALPRWKASWLCAARTGAAIKVLLVYDEMFWRSEALSGDAFCDAADTSGPAFMACDCSSPLPAQDLAAAAAAAGAAYASAPRKLPVLSVFVSGGPAREWSAKDAEARRDRVVDQVMRWFGPRAARPKFYIEKDWGADPWTQGGPMSVFPAARTIAAARRRNALANAAFIASHPHLHIQHHQQPLHTLPHHPPLAPIRVPADPSPDPPAAGRGAAAAAASAVATAPAAPLEAASMIRFPLFDGGRAARLDACGRIHWAGSDVADAFTGSMEGALRSAALVAPEVAAALRSDLSGQRSSPPTATTSPTDTAAAAAAAAEATAAASAPADAATVAMLSVALPSHEGVYDPADVASFVASRQAHRAGVRATSVGRPCLSLRQDTACVVLPGSLVLLGCGHAPCPRVPVHLAVAALVVAALLLLLFLRDAASPN